MCIVRRDHKALCQGNQIILIASAKSQINARQRIPKESRGSSLLGTASHFLIVHYHMYADALLIFSCDQAFHRGKSTLQVIQSGSRNKFLLAAPDGTRHTVVKEQIMSQNLLFCNASSFCHSFKEGSLCALQSVKRQQILLHIVLVSAVRLTVHMNGQIGDHQHILVHCHQLLADLSVLLHDHTSSHRKGSVKPGSQKRTTIKFHIQLHIPVLHHLRILLDLKGRRIAVACNNVKYIAGSLRHRKRNDSRMIPGHKILPAIYQLPVLILLQLCKSIFPKSFLHHLHCLKRSRTLFNKCK